MLRVTFNNPNEMRRLLELKNKLLMTKQELLTNPSAKLMNVANRSVNYQIFWRPVFSGAVLSELEKKLGGKRRKYRFMAWVFDTPVWLRDTNISKSEYDATMDALVEWAAPKMDATSGALTFKFAQQFTDDCLIIKKLMPTRGHNEHKKAGRKDIRQST